MTITPLSLWPRSARCGNKSNAYNEVVVPTFGSGPGSAQSAKVAASARNWPFLLGGFRAYVTFLK
jgi:hypothetical protein